MDYPLENLSDTTFQELAQALLVREHKNVQCFPVGQADGGRDAIAYYAFELGSREREYILFQVKFSRHPHEIKDPSKWLASTIDGELTKIHEQTLRGARQFVLITNVRATGPLDTGRIDVVQNELDKRIPIPSRCWWREDIARRLDDAWAIKWAYPEILTGPDIVRSILESGLGEHATRRTNAIRSTLSYQWDRDREVRFRQVQLQSSLTGLYIDSPLSPILSKSQDASSSKTHALRYIIESASRNEAHRWLARGGSEELGVGACTFFLRDDVQSIAPLCVLEGAPGQGKSTVTQYLCQVHRIRLLNRTDDLAELPKAHQNASTRLPIRVDLRDFASWLSRKDPFSSDATAEPSNWNKSLESFLAALVRYCSGGTDFDASDLLEVARISSMLLVFDGLDEVADIRARATVVDELNKGLSRLLDIAASLQAIITSRPAAFAKSPGMPRERYVHLQLLSLPRDLIEQYATKWASARGMAPRERTELIRVLSEKVSQAHLRDLARNPMQLAILLWLLTARGVSLPDKRTALYRAYMDLFFNRESEKSAIVRDHRDLLEDLHGHLAWVLHSEAEAGKNPTGRITLSRMRDAIADYLQQNGYLTDTVEPLFRGMVERVVAIVSRVQDTYEFEVQPLREYFAAKYLYETAPHSPPGEARAGTKPDRFLALAQNQYWLNVTRFFAGFYDKGELPSLIDNLKELRDRPVFAHLAHPRMLAATLLSDWVFSQHPRSVRETVSMIFDDYGLRYLLAEDSDKTSPSLVMGDPHARDELLKRCWAVLDKNPPRTFAFSVAGLMRANSERDETYDQWQTRLQKNSNKQRWLEYGLHLGHLAFASEDLLNRTVDTHSKDHIRLLARARRYEYLEGQARIDSSLTYVLDGYAYSNGRSDGTALLTLAHALDPKRYALGMRDGLPGPLHMQWARFHGFPALPTAVPACPDAKLGRHIDVVLQVARQESQKTSAEWSTQLAPWNSLVETTRSVFGDAWVLCQLSAIAAGIRSSLEMGGRADDPLDSALPLCERARYARLRSGTDSWWRRHIVARSAPPLEKRLLLLLALRWATPRVIGALSKELSDSIEDIDADSWQQLYHSLTTVDAGPRLASHELDIAAISTLSPRLATVLMLQVSEDAARAIFLRNLATVDCGDINIASARMTMAYREIARTPNWSASLSIIRASFAVGASGDRFAPHWLSREVKQRGLRSDLAAAVCATPDQYPSQLVRLAALKLLEEAMRKVEPVQRIARRDGWFQTD